MNLIETVWVPFLKIAGNVLILSLLGASLLLSAFSSLLFFHPTLKGLLSFFLGSVLDAVTYHMYLGYGGNPNLVAELLTPQFLLSLYNQAVRKKQKSLHIHCFGKFHFFFDFVVLLVVLP